VAPEGYSGRFSLTVPPGRLWVLGDHRDDSLDSRGHVVDPGDGTIPENQVIGRAFVIVWPTSRWRVLPVPATFQQHGIVAAAAGPAGATAPYLPLGAGLAVIAPAAVRRRRRRSRSHRG
jgi:signal peptidase I